MQTRREYAISLGLAKDGRGRMSKEAHSAINKALAEGMRFSDVRQDSDSSIPVTSEQASKDSAAPENLFGPTPEPLYNGGWYVWEGKKKRNISGREVCRGCGLSLDYHRCNLPIFPSRITNEMVPVMR